LKASFGHIVAQLVTKLAAYHLIIEYVELLETLVADRVAAA
jgi:hypothetical protein